MFANLNYKKGKNHFDKKEYKEAIALWEKAAKSGHAEAAYNLGECFSTGVGVPVDYNRALELYLIAAKKSHPKAFGALGDCYEDTFKPYGNMCDDKKAFEYYSKGASLGDANSQAKLASFYYNGYGGCRQDTQKALDLYKKAAAQGHVISKVNLAYFYEKGIGVQQDIKKAYENFKSAADLGSAEAQYILGIWYENGYMVQQDVKKALGYYVQSANNGNFRAESKLKSLGITLQNPPNKKEPDNIVYHYDIPGSKVSSANEDKASSACFRGYMARSGDGAGACYSEVVPNYREAVALGHAGAHFGLGSCYYNGIQVKQDYKKAAELFKIAAEQNVCEAQYYLGNCYYLGRGVSQDIEKAREWYKKAAAQGFSNAKEALKYI